MSDGLWEEWKENRTTPTEGISSQSARVRQLLGGVEREQYNPYKGDKLSECLCQTASGRSGKKENKTTPMKGISFQSARVRQPLGGVERKKTEQSLRRG
jgi:hypothetical protein